MSTSSDSAITVHEAIIAQKDTITRITGDITPEDVDQLQEEIGSILVTIKSHHFRGGRTNGHLAVIVSQAEYRSIIDPNNEDEDDEAWEYEPPDEDMLAYDPEAEATTIARRARLEAEWKRKVSNLEIFNGVCQGAKELIIYGAGEDAVIALKKKYIKYGGVTPKEMLAHLREKTAIKMTMREKNDFKRDGYSQQWDTNSHITTYFTSLDNFHKKLTARSITTSNDKKVLAAVGQMYESGYFEKQSMIDWEKKPTDEQTWTLAQEYFTEL